jgi:hypothetical protein
MASLLIILKEKIHKKVKPHFTVYINVSLIGIKGLGKNN